MIEANNSQHFQQNSSWPFSKLGCMSTSQEQRQAECLPANQSTNMISARSPALGFMNAAVNAGSNMVPLNHIMAVPALPVPDIPSWKMKQGFEHQRLLQNPFRSLETLAPSAEPYHQEKRTGFPYMASSQAMIHTVPGCLPKGFLIFDKSGSQTQLICRAICPSAHYATAIGATQASDPNLHEKQADKEGLFTAEQPPVPEESDEKQINTKETEMHEDTEELNALLYSDEEDDNSYDEDDDIKSTDHSPSVIQGKYHKTEQFEETIGEVASSERPNKRQKQPNGGYMKSLPKACSHSVKLKCSHMFDIDVESSHTSGQIQLEEMGNMSGKKHPKKENIRKMLRILESIVPGAKGKDPFLVLDESINYLKSLKLEAKALGVYHF